MKHKTQKKSIFISILLMSIMLFTGSGISTYAASTSGSFTLYVTGTYKQTEARSMLPMINELRTGTDVWYWNSDNTTKITCSGLSQLTYDYGLEQIAMQRAVEIALNYSHTRTNGERCFSAYNFYYQACGENIAAGYTTANSVYIGWCEEDKDYSKQGHRRNMLSSNFKYVGVACFYYQGINYWVQEFSDTASGVSEQAANDSSAIVSVEIDNSMVSDVTYAASSDSISINENETTALPAVAKSLLFQDSWPQTLRTGSVTADWTVADTGIAVISNGEITGLNAGNTTLTATFSGGTLTVPITVNHNYVAVVTEPTYTSKGYTTYTCSDCGASYVSDYVDALVRNGFMYDEVAGRWTYYVNGKIDTTYTGMAKNDYGWWYVKNGLIDTTYTGMAKNDYGWWYMTKGKLDTSYTGMAKNDYGWWYMTKGKLDTSYTGMAKNDYGWWYITKGKLDTSYTGMAKNDYGWWYITKGKLDTSYTGMAKNDYGWWYMTKGKLDTSYTGMAKNDYGWWYITKGKLDTSYTGMAKNDYGWWYMTKGKMDTCFTGIASNEYGQWYMKNGKLDKTYSGNVKVNGINYQIKNGKVVSNG